MNLVKKLSNLKVNYGSYHERDKKASRNSNTKVTFGLSLQPQDQTILKLLMNSFLYQWTMKLSTAANLLLHRFFLGGVTVGHMTKSKVVPFPPQLTFNRL